MKNYPERESVKVGRASLKLVVAEFISVIFGVFYFLIITRLFSKIEMATVAVMAIVTNLSLVFIGFGFQTTAKKLIPTYLKEKKIEKVSKLLKTNYIVTSLFSLFITFLIFLFSAPIAGVFFKKEGFSLILKIISFNIFTNKLFELSSSTLTAFQKFTELSLIKVLNNVFVRIYSFSLYLYCGISGYLVGLITGQFVLTLWMIFCIKKYFFKKGFYPFKKLVKYSWPFYLNGYVGYGATHADSLLVSIFLRPEILSTYYVAKRFIDYVEIYIVSLLRPLFPKMLELKSQGQETLKKIFCKSTRFLSFTLVPIVFFLLSISYFLLDVYGKGRYISGLPVLIILGIGTIFTGFYILCRGAIFVTGKPIETTKVEFVKAFLNILIPLLLIRKFEIIGVAFGKLLSIILSLFFAVYLGKKLMVLKFDWKNIKKSVVISCFPFLLIIFLQLLFYTTTLTIFYILIGISLFASLFFYNVSGEDKKFLRDLLFKKKNN